MANLRESIDLQKDHFVLEMNLAEGLYDVYGPIPETLGQVERARRLAADEWKRRPASDIALRMMVTADGYLGRHDSAVGGANALLRLAPVNALASYSALVAFELAGRRDLSLAEVRRAFERSLSLADMRASRALRPLLADRRYQELLKEFGRDGVVPLPGPLRPCPEPRRWRISSQ
jgi:hypothetical protein